METNHPFDPASGRILGFLRCTVLLGAVFAAGFLTTGCASMNRVASANDNSTAPDPEWYQSSDNPFHAD